MMFSESKNIDLFKNKDIFDEKKLKIVYSDAYIIVIRKPAGMLSCPYAGCRKKTALSVLEQILRKKGIYSKNHRPLIVHRLDMETSGIMMFAMTESVQKRIMDNWKKIALKRIYRAITENTKKYSLPPEGIIDAPISYNAYNIGFVPNKNSLNKFKSMQAVTQFKILSQGKAYSLFELNLDTGRKNQIRIHLSANGYPIAGDKTYGAKTDPLNRLALHARILEFIHPISEAKMQFESPEPDNWLKLTKA